MKKGKHRISERIEERLRWIEWIMIYLTLKNRERLDWGSIENTNEQIGRWMRDHWYFEYYNCGISQYYWL